MDAESFEANTTGLYLKAGVVLDYETKSSYNVTVEINDTTIGNTPDASTSFTLTVTDINEILPSIISATPRADTLIAGEHFDGVNDIIFTGAGNDAVDATLAGTGSNRAFTGSGADVIDAANNDRVFGGSGDDVLDASDATGYRISGGTGNDQFFLGVGGRALGGDGDDTFTVQEGGGNLLSGGAGSDTFRILTDKPNLLLTPNTIVDFTIGTDSLVIANQGDTVDFTDLSFGNNTIVFNGTTIAILTGVNTGNLTADQFTFI